MTKTPLTERMTKGGAAKAWIKEVETKNKRIEELLQLKEEYLNVIDLLACEKELITKNVEDGIYALSVIRECRRELEEENERLGKAFDAMHKHRYDSECKRCNEIVAILADTQFTGGTTPAYFSEQDRSE